MKTRKTRTPRASKTLAMFLAAGAAIATAVAPAQASPEGETIIYGDVTIVRDGDLTTIYVGDLAIISWTGFDIGAGETVQFIQPGVDSRVLNRILSGAPTEIQGQLLATGQIYLVNPSGVIFGKNAVVNAGAIYTAAGNISNQNFLEGRNRFKMSGGSVVNYGTLEGDLVALVGSSVANHGAIRAREGTVVMAAGEKVMIGERFGSLYVKVDGPSGEVAGADGVDLAAGDVYSLAAWNTGTIVGKDVHVESTGATLVQGTIDASGREGGSVSVLGEAVELRGATIDASGRLGGGTVEIGGAARGKGHTRTASVTVVDADSVVTADAVHKGQGGDITVWSDDLTVVDGELTARGGEVRGDGGLIETSSKGVVRVSRAADASARHGQAGTWLLDPDKVVINNTGTGGDATVTYIDDDIIEAALNGGTNFTQMADTSITLAAGTEILKSAGGNAELSLESGGTISLLGTMRNTSSGAFSLSLFAGSDVLIAGDLDISGVFILNPGVLELAPTADLNLTGGFSQFGASQVLLGSDITAYGQNVMFDSPVTLTDDVVIRAFDGVSTDTPAIVFSSTIDTADSGPYAGDYFLSLDAGNGTVYVGGDIGFNAPLENLRFRGRTVTVQGAITNFQQQYIADTAVFQGSLLQTLGGDRPLGLETAQIEVLGDTNPALGFAGNTRLENNVSMITAGQGPNMFGVGDDVRFAGTVTSAAGQQHTLAIDAGDALAVFGGDVGAGAGSDQRLGFLEVADASETKLFGSVYTVDGMNFWTPVEVNGANTVIHTGDGTAWFGDSIYSAAGEYNDVTFAFDGMPFIELGYARVPFKFTGNVGTNAALETGREFGTILLGSDLGSVPASATFLFANAALPGEALTPLAGTDLKSTFHVWARDAIIAGQGQKLTSFGSLELLATGSTSATTISTPPVIQFGDVNVIGDFTARAVGGEIILRLRDAFGVEGVDTELARLLGMPVELFADLGAEVIVAGDITLDANTITRDASGVSGPGSFLFASNAGYTLAIGDRVLTYPNGVTTDEFLAQTLARGTAGGLLYPYDLALISQLDPNLGLAFRGRDEFNPRYPDRYLPDPTVLAELQLNPRDIPDGVLLASLGEGESREINDYAEEGATPPSEAGTAMANLTLDRLSRPAVTRLTDAYVALLGERLAEGSPERANSEQVKGTLASAWASYSGDPAGFRAWVSANNPDAAGVLAQADAVFAAFERLELPAYEKSAARERLIDAIRPGTISRDQFAEIVAPPAPAEIEQVASR